MSASEAFDKLTGNVQHIEQEKGMKYDHVNPSHYKHDDPAYETIRVIEAWKLDFCKANAAKYISRAGSKPGADEELDLQKAIWYLERRIKQIRGET